MKSFSRRYLLVILLLFALCSLILLIASPQRFVISANNYFIGESYLHGSNHDSYQNSVPEKFCPNKFGKVTILVVVNLNTIRKYTEAQDSLGCYGKARNYEVLTVDPFNDATLIDKCGNYSEFLFRKHCAASVYLGSTDWLMVLDADTGVVNPNHCIEEYIHPKLDLIFYERFHNGEIMAGNYLAKNSPFAFAFLRQWADYNSMLPSVAWNNMDNGALHLHLLNTLVQQKDVPKLLTLTQGDVDKARELWGKCQTLYQYDTYVGFVKQKLFSAQKRVFPHIFVWKRSHGWARDTWVTGSRFSSVDFMLHAMKPPEKSHFEFAIDNDYCVRNAKKPFTLPLRPNLFISNPDEMKKILLEADSTAVKNRPISLLGKSDIDTCWPTCPHA